MKSQAWEKGLETNDEWVLMNYFLQGDKGFTIPEVFKMLKMAELEMINMVNWRQWEPLDLFENPENLPGFLALSLPELSIEHRLHFYELLHPIHRLLDFWCGHPSETTTGDISDWTQTDWETATVDLHPQLKTDQAKQDLIECIRTHQPYEISQYVKLPTLVPLNFESYRVSCLLPLWEGKQSILSLVERWKQIQPVDPVTLELVSDQMAFEQVKELLNDLEPFLYILLERSL